MYRFLSVLLCLVAGACFVETTHSSPQVTTLTVPVAPAGYTWSAPLTKPRALFPSGRIMYARLAAGNYDFECRPIGDNWALAAPGAFTSVKLTYSGNATILPRFPVDEPSCGFLILMRGPYADGTAESARGEWTMSFLNGGLGFGRASAPIYTHVGARYARYSNNGFPWMGSGNYPALANTTYWGDGQAAVGPLKFGRVFTPEDVTTYIKRYGDGGVPPACLARLNQTPNLLRLIAPKPFSEQQTIVASASALDALAPTLRMPIKPAAVGPDVTIVSSIPNKPIWVAYALVDMLGRETPISDPVLHGISDAPYDNGTFAVLARYSDAAMGTCGFHVYAGFSPTDLHRQPVLDYQGRQPRYLWPLWLQSFVLHQVVTNTPAPSPSTDVKSLLNYQQRQVVAGKRNIEQNPWVKTIVSGRGAGQIRYIDEFDKQESNFSPGPDSTSVVTVTKAITYDLYCPFILHYDSNNFGRTFTGKAKYTHKTVIDNQSLETDIPLLLLQNQDDRPTDMSFVSTKAIVGAATADFSGGQAFGNVLTRCGFSLSSGEETYGALVDEQSSTAVGGHTASEMRFVGCTFAATIPTKIEGNQSAKIRFQEACEFYSTGSPRYPADTVGIAYQCSSNDVHYTQIRGVNGSFRTLFCSAGQAGAANILATDLFCDAGCPVYITFGSYLGGNVTLRDGERINATGQWARLVEAPTAFGANVSVKGLIMTSQTSSISFMFNQLTLDMDVAPGEVVAPTTQSWQAKGIGLEYAGPASEGNPAYFDWTKRRLLRTGFGFSNVADTVPATTLKPLVPVPVSP